MNIRNFFEWLEDFFGSGTFTATAADNAPMLIKDTSSSGTPTYAYVDGSESGEIKLTFDNTNEVQIITLYQGNNLQFDIDKIREVTFRLKVGQTNDSATTLVFGLAGDQNDAPDSVAQNCWFKASGGNTVVLETDDGTTDTDDVATGQSLGTTHKDFTISFACGKSDIRFFIDGQPVGQGQTFSMANYSGSLQAFLQFQKTADTNVDSVTVDMIQVRGIR